MRFERMRSGLDESVNLVHRTYEGQAIECRYVRREDHEVVVYLSSQTGCARRCSFCHLTATGQLRNRDVTVQEFGHQAGVVLDEVPDPGEVEVLNWNFMARGEPLSSRTLWSRWEHVVEALADVAGHSFFHHVAHRFKVSTILPRGPRPRLWGAFPRTQPDVYYSLYSFDAQWLASNMPDAADPLAGLRELAEWQQRAHKIPRVHFPPIAGVNDDPRHLETLREECDRLGLVVGVNLVEFNPPAGSDLLPGDADAVEARALALGFRTKRIPRVGYDVAASCGMFVGGTGR